MSRPTICNWTPVDFEAVCQTQNANGGDFLNLNGTFSVPSNIVQYLNGIPETPNVVVFPAMTRRIIISTFNDLTGVNFTINGTYNGQKITEVLAGPNNALSTSVNYFSTIENISVDADAIQFAIGTASTGYTAWNLYNYNQPSYNQVTVVVKVQGNITYNFVATLDDVTKMPANDIYTFDPTGGQMTNANNTRVASSSACVRYYAIYVSAADDNASLNVTFLAQGE